MPDYKKVLRVVYTFAPLKTNIKKACHLRAVIISKLLWL